MKVNTGIFILFSIFIFLLNTHNSFSQTSSPLTLSEIMFSPAETNGEFVEVFNTSLTQSVDLNGYKIKYHTSSNNNLVSVAGGTILGPKKYAVIIQGSYDLSSGIYKTLIPGNTIILRTSGNNFGSSGMANTTSRVVNLINPSGQIADTYTYSANNTAGYSDEKIEMTADNSSINWNNSIILHGTPGYKNSVSPVNYDLSVRFLPIFPVIPKAEDSVSAKTAVKNTGKKTAQNFRVEIFKDVNFDSFGQIEENIFSELYPSLSANDSIIIEKKVYIDYPGLYSFIAEVSFAEDENILNSKSFLNFTALEKPAEQFEIVINEIMYSPTDDEPEWIEIYNRSDRSLNLKNYSVGDNSAMVVISYEDFVINPGEFLVLSDDVSINNYHQIPSRVIIKSLPSLNNSGDDIILHNNEEETVDSVKYFSAWGGAGGKSLERIAFDSLTVNASNWKTSFSQFKSTPGKINSVSPKDHDISVNGFTTSVNYIEAGRSLDVKVTVKNFGNTAAEDFTIRLFNDRNMNSIGEPAELIEENKQMLLEAADTNEIIFSVSGFLVGVNRLIVLIDYEEDQYTDNNSMSMDINAVIINEQRNDIVINEIMYAPNSPECEWIELFNRSSKELELKGYQIADDVNKYEIISETLIIKPDEFLIICRDSIISSLYHNISRMVTSTFPSLNNTGDRIVLMDSLGRTIDSLEFDLTWGGAGGKSLERISPDNFSIDGTNWKSSASKYKATPGRINSLSGKKYDLSITKFISNPKYVEIGNYIKLEAGVENTGTEAADNFSVKFFLDKNMNMITEENEIIGEFKENVLMPGYSNQVDFSTAQLELGANQIIVYVDFDKDQYYDNNTGMIIINAAVLNEVKGDVVINEIMYEPLSSEPEWIEIFNKSNKQIDLQNYCVGDGTDKKMITKFSSIIIPGEYFVVAGDSAFFSLYETASKIFISDFPSLGNSRDKIVLSDSLGRIIDSLEYKYTWGGGSGKSLERIDVFLSSTDSTNWRTSFVDKGGTPGKNNSIEKIIFDGAVTKIFFIPDKPQIGEEVKIKVEAANAGKNSISAALVLYELIPSSSKIIIEHSSAIAFSAGESVIYEFQYKINSINSKHTFEVELELADDNNPANNKLPGSIQPCYKPNFILLNEIMFNPINGEPEWIELYNNSEYNIDIGDWSITDILTKPVKTKIKEEIIPPRSFLIITKDSSVINYHQNILSALLVNEFANLNNDEDGVILKDTYGVTIDSVRYDKTWGGENGKSLERKSYALPSTDKLNWVSSTDIEQSTPGRVNSSAQKEFDLAVTQINFVPEFPILGNEISCCAKIKNIGIKDAQSFLVNFSFINETDTTLFSSVNIAELKTLDSIMVNTAAQMKMTEPGKILCQIIFYSDQDVYNNYLFKTIRLGCKYGSVLISEIMYNPLNGESEWIEIVNNSLESINLKDWSASDIINPTKACITKNDCVLMPNEFCVLASDTGKYFFFPPPKFFQVKFGSLDNTSDGLMIYDFWNNVIDSVAYNSNWGSAKGFSLERISLSSPSCDCTNWTISLNENGATPGIINSITEKTSYSRNSLIINEIMFDPLPGNSEFIELYNAASDTIQIGGMTLQAGIDNPIMPSHTFNLIPPGSYIVLAKDSSVINNYRSEINCLLVNSSLDLSNEGAQIILRDMTGSCIDSLIYSPSWHNKNILSTKNRSLERLNPSTNSNDVMNWSSSVNSAGATPGKQNSVFVQNVSGKAKVTINPNPFSPDNDGFEDFTTINFNLTKHLAQVRIKIFDSAGRHVRTLVHNAPAVSNNTIIFDGLDDNNRALRVGIYILLIEAVADDGSTETLKIPIVVARKL